MARGSKKAAKQRAVVEPVANDFDSILMRESEDFALPTSFIRHAVGFCEKPVFTSNKGTLAEIVLASDGARLGEAQEVVSDTETLRAWLTHVEQSTPRDDYTVVAITLV